MNVAGVPFRTKQSHIYRLYDIEQPDVTLYIGRAKGPSKRLEQHHAGIVPTTRKGAERSGVDLPSLHMEIVMRFSDKDWPTAEGYIIKAYQEIGQAKWNFPYALTRADVMKSVATRRRNGFRELVRARKKSIEKRRAVGYESFARAGREAHRKMGYPGLIKALENRRAKGFRSLKDGLETRRSRGFPELRAGLNTRRILGFPELQKGLETNRSRGFTNLKKGLHVRWHINRGITNATCRFCKEE